MKIFSLLLLIVLTSPLYAAENLPVSWTKFLPISSLKNIPALERSETYVGSETPYINDQQKEVIAKTCRDYFTLTKKRYEPASNAAISQESYFKEKCDPLPLLQKAKPAKISYLRHFNLAKDFHQLPRSVIFPDMEGNLSMNYQPIENYPDVFIDTTQPVTKTAITLKEGTQRAAIHVLAWGDFNDDGIDDMLIFVGNYITDGTYHTYSVYLVTQKGANDKMTPIET